MPSGRTRRQVPRGRRGGATRVRSSSASIAGAAAAGGGGGGGGSGCALIGGPPKLGTSIIADPGATAADTAAGDTSTACGGMVATGALMKDGGGATDDCDSPCAGGAGGGGGDNLGTTASDGTAKGTGVTGNEAGAASARRTPQLPQNVAPTRVVAPHEVQLMSEPEDSLNRALNRSRVPICGHSLDVDSDRRPLP